MTQSGEDCYSNADPSSQQETHAQSMSQLLPNLVWNLAGEDGCQTLSGSTRAIYWAITSWETVMDADTIVMMLKQMKHLQSLVGSAQHACVNLTGQHRHWLLKMTQQIRVTSFPLQICQNCWLAPIIASGGDTIKDALAKYLNYIKGKGLGHIELGPPITAG